LGSHAVQESCAIGKLILHFAPIDATARCGHEFLTSQEKANGADQDSLNHLRRVWAGEKMI
jgi:hypothetical protein